MKKTTIALAIALTTLTTGCTTFHASQYSADLSAKVNGNINTDIDVGEKITGDSKVVTVLGFLNFGDDKFADGVSYGSGSSYSFGGRAAEEAKSAASYKAITNTKADVIVMPRYSIEVADFLIFKTTEVHVIGNKGLVKSFRPSDSNMKN